MRGKIKGYEYDADWVETAWVAVVTKNGKEVYITKGKTYVEAINAATEWIASQVKK